jgi:ferrous iron transport protein B
MLFILTYFPCIGVVAAIKRESGSWKWAVFTIFYTTGMAWVLSFTVYQVGSLFII